MLCLCVKDYYWDSGEAEAVRVTLQLFQTIGKDFTFFDLPPVQSRYKALATPSTGKEAGQYFLESGSCLGTSAKEQNFHNFQHPTILADNGFLSEEVLGLCLLEKTAANDTHQTYRANNSMETAAY